MAELTGFLPVILVAFFIWLIGLSVSFYYILSHYRKLGRKTKEGNIISALDKVLSSEERNQEDIKKIWSSIESLTRETRVYIQKYGLVRFNPFHETGGDQSFSLCLLDKQDSGFVLTCLHTRDRTRVYAKPVDQGKPKYELSKEETSALKEAVKKR